MNRAILFPGQGSQFVGMGKDFLEAEPAARRIFEAAREVLGFDLAEVCAEGPVEDLNRTEICQPAILTTSVAIVESLGGADLLRGVFRATAGLSLGEYTALVFAGALGFQDAVALVRKRGQFMQACSDRLPGGMVSLLGTDEATAKKVCDRVRDRGVAGVANLNGGGQVVVSGSREAMKGVVEVAREFGIRRAVPLQVSGAFHSELMRDASKELSAELESVKINSPRIRFVSNVSGREVEDPATIRELLGAQVCSPVRWEDSMGTLSRLGTDEFVEPGPGKVLTGLAKKIDRGASTRSISSHEEMLAFRDASESDS